MTQHAKREHHKPTKKNASTQQPQREPSKNAGQHVAQTQHPTEASQYSIITQLQGLIGNQQLTQMLQRQDDPTSLFDFSDFGEIEPGDFEVYRGEPPPIGHPMSEDHSDADVQRDYEGNILAVAPNNRMYISELATFPRIPTNASTRPELLMPNPEATYFSLLDQCEEIAEEQLAYAEELKGDMKYWFAKVYHYVTKFELEAIKAGTYAYPHMKLQEVVLFHETYKQNIDAWEADERENVEENWRAAFQMAEAYNNGDWLLPRSAEIAFSLLPSMEAHIRFDLPRAIAAAYMKYYEGIPGTSMDDFQADFFKMDSVFAKANAAIAPEIDYEAWAVDPGSWDWLADLAFPVFFDIQQERQWTWERAERIVEEQQLAQEYGGLLGGFDDESMSVGVNNTFPAGTMGVGTWHISDYEWFNQPDPEPMERQITFPPEVMERLQEMGYLDFDPQETGEENQATNE